MAEFDCVVVNRCEFWIGRISKTIARINRDVFTVPMLGTAQIGKNQYTIYYGDRLTYTIMLNLGIVWGNGGNGIHGLQSGYTYDYYITEKKFVITDAQGQQTIKTNIQSLADLNVTWSVIASHQFKIIIDNMLENKDSYFPLVHRGCKYENRDLIMPNPNTVFFVDEYLKNAPYHIRFKRMLMSNDVIGATGAKGNTNSGNNGDDVWEEPENPITIDGEMSNTLVQVLDEAQDAVFIRSNVLERSWRGDYGVYAISGMGYEDLLITLPHKSYDATQLQSYWLLMIYHFAESILHKSHPVYEPWMLWQIWQWVYKASVIVQKDKIFDLSPRWG